MTAPDPVLHPTPILSLRPTQMTVGWEEVRRKRDVWKANATADLAKFLSQHMVPTIIGPRGRHYLIDHHHLALALHEEGIESVFVTVAADLSRLPEGHFWNMMSFKGWTHPYNGEGVRRPYADLPKTVAGLEDDPYRSLAGALRNNGGFAKDFDPVRRVSVGGLLPAAHQGQDDQDGFRRSSRRGARHGQNWRRRLPAGLVRSARLRAVESQLQDRQEEQGRECPISDESAAPMGPGSEFDRAVG